MVEMVMTDEEELVAIERCLAYECATGAIESECVRVSVESGEATVWFDVSTAACDLADELKYLQSRRLLMVHPSNPRWVSFCDEDEPNAEVIR